MAILCWPYQLLVFLTGGDSLDLGASGGVRLCVLYVMRATAHHRALAMASTAAAITMSIVMRKNPCCETYGRRRIAAR